MPFGSIFESFVYSHTLRNFVLEAPSEVISQPLKLFTACSAGVFRKLDREKLGIRVNGEYKGPLSLRMTSCQPASTDIIYKKKNTRTPKQVGRSRFLNSSLHLFRSDAFRVVFYCFSTIKVYDIFLSLFGRTRTEFIFLIPAVGKQLCCWHTMLSCYLCSIPII